MIVRTVAPSTLAIAAATRRYRFHSRLARAQPHLPPVRPRQHAGQLRVRVVHVEDFIVQDLFEDGARLRIVIHELPVDRKAAGGGFFRHVQEGEQAMVGLVLDRQVVQPVPAGERRPVEERAQVRGTRAEERGAALTEEIAVMQLVDRVLEVETAQEAGRASAQPRAGCHVRRRTRLRRTRAACARAGRNRSTPIGEPGAESDPLLRLAPLEAYRLREDETSISI